MINIKDKVISDIDIICSIVGLVLIIYGTIKPVPNTVNPMNASITALCIFMFCSLVYEKKNK